MTEKRWAWTSCCVKVCPFKDAERTFHKIPKKPSIRQSWFDACGFDSVNLVSPKICSHHFCEDDFQRDFRAELMNCKPRRRLKTNAVPSLYLSLEPDERPPEKYSRPGSEHSEHHMEHSALIPERARLSNEVSGLSDECSGLSEKFHPALSEECSVLSEERSEPSEERSEPSEERSEPSEECSEPSEERSVLSEERSELSEEHSEPSEECSEPSDERSGSINEHSQPEEQIQSVETQMSEYNHLLVVEPDLNFFQDPVDFPSQLIQEPVVCHDQGSQTGNPRPLNKSVQADIPNTLHKRLLKRIKSLENLLSKERRRRMGIAYKLRSLRSNKHEKSIFESKLIEAKFTQSQAKKIVHRKQVKEWGMDDIIQGLVMRFISLRLYKYIHFNTSFPVPSLTTLKNYIKKYRILPGIQFVALQMLQEKMVIENKNLNNLCVLVFDEMDIRNVVEFDQREDRVYGPHKKLMTVICRGICCDWKQIIYVNFDCQMTKKLLRKLIFQVEFHGLEVHGVVMDLGNQKLMSQIKFYKTKSALSIPNCYDRSRKVHIFPDPPHLIKSLRNHLLDGGFHLGDNKYLFRRDFEQLLDQDNGEIKLAHKLTREHFAVKGLARQRVRCAAQVFSHTSATLLRKLKPHMVTQADFVDGIDSYFNVLNSRVLTGKKNLDSAFGHVRHFEDQLRALEFASKTVQKLRAVKYNEEKGTLCEKPGLLPCQQGIIYSCSSLKNLFNYLRKKHKVDFLLTAKLNADCIENTHTRLRGLSNTHPGPTQVLDRIRLLELGKNVDAIVSRPSVEFEHTSVPSVQTFNSISTRQPDDCQVEKFTSVASELQATLDNADDADAVEESKNLSPENISDESEE